MIIKDYKIFIESFGFLFLFPIFGNNFYLLEKQK